MEKERNWESIELKRNWKGMDEYKVIKKNKKIET